MDHCRNNQIYVDNVMQRTEKVLDWLDRAKVILKVLNFFQCLLSVIGIAAVYKNSDLSDKLC